MVAEQNGMEIREYTPNEIKKALTGYGSATKTQMEEMARVHLGLKEKPKPDDAADALAAAVTCGLMYRKGEVQMVDKFSNSRKKLDFFTENDYI